MQTIWQRNVIALTGITGSGKTTVANIFKELGAYVVEADQLAREALNPASPAFKQVLTIFGQGILTPDNKIDRKKLGQIVFNNPEARKQLEQILHPLIKTLAQEKFSLPSSQNSPLRIYDVPLFFEAGLDKQGFQKIIVVTAPKDLCLSRIITRDKLPPEDAQSRLSSQIPIEEKEKRADIVIENLGTLEELREKVVRVFKKLNCVMLI